MDLFLCVQGFRGGFLSHLLLAVGCQRFHSLGCLSQVPTCLSGLSLSRSWQHKVVIIVQIVGYDA